MFGASNFLVTISFCIFFFMSMIGFIQALQASYGFISALSTTPSSVSDTLGSHVHKRKRERNNKRYRVRKHYVMLNVTMTIYMNVTINVNITIVAHNDKLKFLLGTFQDFVLYRKTRNLT